MPFAIRQIRHPQGSRLRRAALLLVLVALPLVTLVQSAGAIVAPAITGISPSSGPSAGGTVVTITGTGFLGATSVKFGATSVGVGSINIAGTSMTATSPLSSVGTVHVRVLGAPGGTSPAVPADLFTFFTTPNITGLDPSSGPTAGGTVVTVFGSGFSGVTSVTFGGTLVSPSNVSNGSLTVVAPAHAIGVVDIRVATPAGTSPNTSADNYTYANGPVVTSVSPSSGLTAGGTTVTISGSGFAGATSVTFGGSFASILQVLSTQIIVVSPPHIGGTYDVIVNTPAGPSLNTAADNFTFVGSAFVTGIFPSSGPIAGGTVVAVTGGGFLGATAVSFGGTLVLPSNVTDGQLIVVSPPGLAGQVHVQVIVAAVASPATNADIFTYTGVVVTAISPSSGPASGGTVVTITGSGFLTTTSVSFGNVGAASIQSITNTQIIAVSPDQGAGTVHVRVNTPGGSSPSVAADQFTYVGTTTLTYTLYFRWNLIVWNGLDNILVSAAIRGQETPANPATNDVSSLISAIFHWVDPQQIWQGYFPSGEAFPGANDFTTFRTGQPYWIAITQTSGVTWTVSR